MPLADLFGFDPVRPLTDNRTLLIKYSHTDQQVTGYRGQSPRQTQHVAPVECVPAERQHGRGGDASGPDERTLAERIEGGDVRATGALFDRHRAAGR